MRICIVFILISVLFNSSNDVDSNLNNTNDIKPEITISETEKVLIPINEDDFGVNSINTDLELGCNFNNIVFADTLENTILANEVKAYNLYEFSDFTLKTSSKDENTIFYIQLFTPKYETNRGVKVGDDIQLVVENYGEPSIISKFESSTSHSYLFSGYVLSFISNEKHIITKIYLELI